MVSTLSSLRLTLKEIAREDIPDLHKKNSNRAVEEFNTIGIPESIKQTEEYYLPVIEDRSKSIRTKFGWTIIEKNTNAFIGETGLILAAERFRMGEIHYSLLPEFWGRGYATEAVKTVISFAFKKLGLHRIEAGVATENLRSIRLLENMGFTREGTRRKILPIRGEWKDNFHYALLDED